MTTETEWREGALRVMRTATDLWSGDISDRRSGTEVDLDALISAGYVTPPQSGATRDIMAKLSDLGIAMANIAVAEPNGHALSVVSILREAQAEIMRLRQVAPQPDAVPEGHVRWCIPVQRGEDGSIFIDGEQRVRGWFTRYPDHPVIATIIADMPLPSEPPEIKGKVKTP